MLNLDLRHLVIFVALVGAPACTPGPLQPGDEATETGGTHEDSSLPRSECVFDVSSDLSSAIPTVGIVTWSVDAPQVASAVIEFGPDLSYGMNAPVDLSASDHRTLLLGMAPSTTYHFRVTATMGDALCHSDDFTLTTGPAPNGLLAPTVTVAQPELVEPGFLLTSTFGSAPRADEPGPSGSGQVLIYDHRGTPVWWYSASANQLSRAKLTWDGNWIYAVAANPAGSGAGRVVRISLDGLQEEEILSVPTAHHDLTVTPDGGVVFIAGSDDHCDEIVKLLPDGTVVTLFSVLRIYGEGRQDLLPFDLCHTNSIQYNISDDTFTLSSLNLNSYAKVTSSGETVWILGSAGDFTGDGASWVREHGHQMLSPTRLLFFNNGRPGEDALAIEVELDLAAKTAHRVWTYDGGFSSQTFGDVQRLESGNTIVTYSNAGVIDEVDSYGALVQRWMWGLGGAVGYVTHRPSLYGPPPESK